MTCSRTRVVVLGGPPFPEATGRRRRCPVRERAAAEGVWAPPVDQPRRAGRSKCPGAVEPLHFADEKTRARDAGRALPHPVPAWASRRCLLVCSGARRCIRVARLVQAATSVSSRSWYARRPSAAAKRASASEIGTLHEATQGCPAAHLNPRSRRASVVARPGRRLGARAPDGDCRAAEGCRATAPTRASAPAARRWWFRPSRGRSTCPRPVARCCRRRRGSGRSRRWR